MFVVIDEMERRVQIATALAMRNGQSAQKSGVFHNPAQPQIHDDAENTKHIGSENAREGSKLDRFGVAGAENAAHFCRDEFDNHGANSIFPSISWDGGEANALLIPGAAS
jgi:hypothetical protein